MILRGSSVTPTLFFTTAAALLYLTCGQEVFVGWCPNVRPINPFNIKRYSGVWYEVEKYWFIPEALGTCVRVRYGDNGDGTFSTDIYQQVLGNKVWHNPGVTRYTTSANDGANFILDLVVRQSPIPFVVSYPYLVLDTDYRTYTIKYRCKQVGFFNFQTMWILTRDKFLSPQLQKMIHNKLEAFGLDSKRLIKTDLSTCPAN